MMSTENGLIEEESSISEDESNSPKHQRLVTEQPNITETAFGSSPKSVDRHSTCPMYVRLFCRMNGHHRFEEFSPNSQPLSDELTIYTWWDASLKELSDLIKEVNIECRRKDARFSFQLVYQDLKGRFLFKNLGLVWNSRSGKDDNLTLKDLRFIQGDFIDVAILFGHNHAITTNDIKERTRYFDNNSNRRVNTEKRTNYDEWRRDNRLDRRDKRERTMYHSDRRSGR